MNTQARTVHSALTRDNQDLSLDMEGARDHEQASGVRVEPPGGCIDVPALTMACLAVESHLHLGPLVHPPDDGSDNDNIMMESSCLSLLM